MATFDMVVTRRRSKPRAVGFEILSGSFALPIDLRSRRYARAGAIFQKILGKGPVRAPKPRCSGEVNAGGLLFVGNGANTSSSVSAIFDDLRAKGIIGHAS